MTTITPATAQSRIDRADVLTSLAEIHTVWGEIAWNSGNYPTAVVHWKAAARYAKATAGAAS